MQVGPQQNYYLEPEDSYTKKVDFVHDPEQSKVPIMEHVGRQQRARADCIDETLSTNGATLAEEEQSTGKAVDKVISKWFKFDF